MNAIYSFRTSHIRWGRSGLGVLGHDLLEERRQSKIGPKRAINRHEVKLLGIQLRGSPNKNGAKSRDPGEPAKQDLRGINS